MRLSLLSVQMEVPALYNCWEDLRRRPKPLACLQYLASPCPVGGNVTYFEQNTESQSNDLFDLSSHTCFGVKSSDDGLILINSFPDGVAFHQGTALTDATTTPSHKACSTNQSRD